MTSTTNPTNDKNLEVNYGYGVTEVPSFPKKPSPKSHSLRLSSLPESLRASVVKMNLDKSGDGELNEEEIVNVVDTLASTTKVNKTLKLVVGGLCVFAVLLVGCVFGATIAAARLTKQTDIDPITGIMYSKDASNNHSHLTTMKTEDVVIYADKTKIIDMTNDQLKNLKEILMTNGDIKFQIKGYARGQGNNSIGLLVEGGTIVYDLEGFSSATGDAKVLLDLAYGTQEDEVGLRRYLSSSDEGECTDATESTLDADTGERRLSSTCDDQSPPCTWCGTGASNGGRSF